MERKTKILLYEFISAGGLGAATTAQDSLLAQGISMRDAVLADLLALADVETTALDCAAAPLERGRTIRVPAGAHTVDFLLSVAGDFDHVWVIAPESDGILLQLCEAIGAARWVGCDADSIRIATSKRATCARLAEAGITVPWGWMPQGGEPSAALLTRPWVVKPDDGAGAEQTRVFSGFAPARDEALRRISRGQPTRLEAWAGGKPDHARDDGHALSLSMLCRPDRTELLSINRQRIALEGDGTVQYRGVDVGAIPLDSALGNELRQLARRIGAALPGLAGFVGVDLVLAGGPRAGADSAYGDPVVIEVNPRVTCAYVGQSVRHGCNLAAEILNAVPAATLAPRSAVERPQEAAVGALSVQ